MLTNRRAVLYAVVVASTWSFACASINSQRIQFVKDHPQLPVDRQNAIISGEIVQGMGQDEVKASLGQPVNTAQETGPDGRQITRWIYFKRMGPYLRVYEVRFVEGKAQELVSDGYMRSRTSGIYSGAMVSE